jgi:hypothetical protein
LHNDLIRKIVPSLGGKTVVPHWPFGTYDWPWVIPIPSQGNATLEVRMQSAPGGAEVSHRHQHFLRSPEPVVLGFFEEG